MTTVLILENVPFSLRRLGSLSKVYDPFDAVDRVSTCT